MEPPFDAGRPELAPAAVLGRLTAMMAGPVGEITRALQDLRLVEPGRGVVG
ncbi:hypothetical protein HRW07_21350 [Streptomyces lunaelactis]|uniref:hypothetical protein n=1 Tax=Streptomyces lunaelactis TaxID=1535768 RepID=UPI001585172B|nr:hypothetical protein [Streptomyces lunaelactis]NUL05730.1 hypothetical protein [Streptomyces lunaelactis]